jgi:hypothetical protein
MAKQTFTAAQVLTAAQMNTLQANDYNWTVDTKTDSYVLVAGDAGKRIVMNATTAKTITVNTGIFSAGDTVWIHNIGTGSCTVTAGTATVNTAGNLALAQWEGGSLYFTSASTAIFFRGGGATALTQTVAFTTTGTNSWTVPDGVTYVIANIIGGGGGTGIGATAGGNGTASSVAFSAGTVTAAGGNHSSTTDTTHAGTAQANQTPNRYGDGAITVRSGSNTYCSMYASRGAYVRAGGAVTPGATLTITVGAGGTAGTNGSVGQQGYVWLEYGVGSKRRCQVFTSSGTFNPPSGVTTVTAYLTGGGGGTNWGDGGGGDGGSTTVGFTAGTVTALGGKGLSVGRGGFINYGVHVLGANNSGMGGFMSWAATTGPNSSVQFARDGQYRVFQGAVAFGTGVTITIGAGGASQTGNSGSGVCWIEYDVP